MRSARIGDIMLTNDRGYNLFKVGSENIVAVQKVYSKYYLIPTERPAITKNSWEEVMKELENILGKDFCCEDEILNFLKDEN